MIEIDEENVRNATVAALFRDCHAEFNFNDAFSAFCCAEQLYAQMMGWC